MLDIINQSTALRWKRKFQDIMLSSHPRLEKQNHTLDVKITK